MTPPIWPVKRRILLSVLLTAGLLAAGLTVGLSLRRKPVSPVLAAARSDLALDSVLPLEEAVRLHPQDPAARRQLAQACLSAGDPAGAALALSPPAMRESTDTMGSFVTACLRTGWLDEAEAAIRPGPGATSLRLELAAARVNHGESARAAQILSDLHPEALPADGAFAGANLLLRARRYADAVRWAERGRAQEPQDLDGMLTAVRCYLAAGRPEAALPLFPDRTSGPLSNPEAEFWRGRVELRCGVPELRTAGRQRLVRVAASPPTADGRQAIAAFEAGRADLESGQVNEAIRLLTQAWKAGYQPTFCLYLLQTAYATGGHNRDAAWCAGQLHLTLHQWPDAVAAFRRCLALDATKTIAYLDLARALSSEGRLADALAVLQQGEKREPRNVDLALLKAAVLGRMEKVADQERVLTQVAEGAGNRSNEPLGNIGKLRYDSQQFDQAIPVLEQALRIDDGDAFAHLYLGLTYARRPEDPHQAQLAVRHLLRAARIQPDYHYPWVNAGSVLLGMNALPEAAACYRRAIDGDPRWDGPYLALAQIYQRQKLGEERRFVLGLHSRVQTQDAQRQEIETRAKAPKADAEAHFAMGDRSLRDGRPKEALAELLIAVAQRPAWKDAQRRVADACALLDFDSMREEAERAAR